MRIKSYFARTVEDAMALARQELGPDAMLMNSRHSPPESRHLGEYEVVFAAEADSSTAPEPAAERSLAAGAHAFSERLSLEVAELKKEMEGMRRALTRSAFAPSQWLASSPDLSEAYAALTANDVAPELAREIVQGAAARVAGPRRSFAAGPQALGDGFGRAIVEELESRIAVEPVLGTGEAGPRIVAFVGPPGSGKTTTLVKLAVNYGLSARRPVLLLSMDTYRVAAAEQLRSYASILGVGFQVLETAGALAQAVQENSGKELILIDTPGFGFGDLDYAEPLARFLSTRSDIDTHLVLSCSMKSADLTRVAASFECFRARKLLFTRLDETASYGPILNEAARTGKPLSFLGTGQRIPEDLEAATRSRVSELVLGSGSARAIAAA